MNAVTVIGKYLFAIPFIVFGIIKLLSGYVLISMVPPGGMIWVYVSGLCMLFAGVAILIGKKDAVATFLLGCVMIVSALMVLPTAFTVVGTELVETYLLKDLALAGAAFVYCRSAAKDRTTNLT